jgi:hypothetical protein
VIERVNPSGSATVQLTLTYAVCSDWRTLVGGGPDAFH